MSEINQYYQQLFESTRQQESVDWFNELQQSAMASFLATGFPNRHDEDWKYTSVEAIKALRLSHFSNQQITQQQNEHTLNDDGALNVNVYNGCILGIEQVHQELPPGCILLSLHEAMIQHPEVVKTHLAQYAEMNAGGFSSLNLALFSGGLFIYVPENCVIERPIVINHYTGDHNVSHNFRHLVIVGQGAEIKLVEKYAGSDESIYFTNTICEISLAEKAQLTYCKVQDEGRSAYHIGTTHLHQQRGSLAKMDSFSVGGRLVRSDIAVQMLGEGADCQLNGLYLVKDKQHVDHHTSVLHNVANTSSREYYKGILSGEARAVFNGKVVVAVDAQKTDASQQNKNLLLSRRAEVDTKPQLEIFADDVKCAHGATVGQLDEDALFYLRCRGLSTEVARSLLVNAFANDLLQQVPFTFLNRELNDLLHHYLIGI